MRNTHGVEEYMSSLANMGEDEKRMWGLYMQVIHAAGVGDVKEWMKLDISMTQMKILMLLNGKREMTVSELAEALPTSLSNMTGVLDRLEGLGFIERTHSSKDRRSVNITLTDESRNMFGRLVVSGHQKLTQALDTVSEEEKRIIGQGLELLAKALRTV